MRILYLLFMIKIDDFKDIVYALFLGCSIDGMLVYVFCFGLYFLIELRYLLFLVFILLIVYRNCSLFIVYVIFRGIFNWVFRV